MKLPYLFILIAGVLPLLCTGIAKWGFQNYDNRNPRAWLANQTGFRARANAAQSNSFEAFPFFAAAVLAAVQSGVAVGTINTVAGIYIVSRLVYIACYVADKASLRSLVWGVGYACVIGLLIGAMTAG